MSRRPTVRTNSSFGVGVFAGGFVVVLAVHPDRFSGWALCALSPLFVHFVYSLVFRTPPERVRMQVASAVAGGYSLVYGLAAGFGDESYTDVARVVYLFLPALGLLALIACIPLVELHGALVAARAARAADTGTASFDAFPVGRAAIVAAALLGGWTTFALAGWTSPKVVVARDEGKDPALVARVRCEGRDTYLLTPAVVRHDDGVHVRIDNRTGGERWLEYEIDGGAHGGGAELVPPGASERRITLPATTIGVVCSKEGNGDASDYARLAVTAPLPNRAAPVYRFLRPAVSTSASAR
jgi:hypothetical protein